MTFLVILSPMSHTCREPISKNPITNVLPNNVCGDSPSKPSPVIIDFVAWNTRLPRSSAHPTPTIMFTMSPVMGTELSKYDKSIVKIVSKEFARYSVILIIISNIH